MLLRTRTVNETRVRFFPTLAALQKEMGKRQGFLLKDPNCPWPAQNAFPELPLLAGEDCKRWRELEKVLDWLSDQGAERSHSLLGLGGGSTLDLTALAASLYRRGMELVLVPTTLLAMVDASLGGKTAVDRDGPQGLNKNFAGTFYLAKEIWIHLGFLSSLPKRERISGAGEVWKALWLSGQGGKQNALYAFVESGEVSPALLTLVKRCLEYKRKIVTRDPLDTKRIRESLNYGHTVGHALESLAKGRLSHGECVLWGMAVESAFLGKKGETMKKLTAEALRALGLALPAEFLLEAKRWEPLLAADKKSKGGQLEMTVLARPGSPSKIKTRAKDLACFVAEFRKFNRHQ